MVVNVQLKKIESRAIARTLDISERTAILVRQTAINNQFNNIRYTRLKIYNYKLIINCTVNKKIKLKLFH